MFTLDTWPGTDAGGWAGLRIDRLEDGSTLARMTLGDQQQGPPQHAHGGVLALLLDETMGAAVWVNGHAVLAVNLNINFRLPVPLGVPLEVRGRVDEVFRRKVTTTGEIVLPDGTVAVTGSGVFARAPEHILERAAAMYQKRGD
jgi:uncharacterized protein (TIGR00369 family)